MLPTCLSVGFLVMYPASAHPVLAIGIISHSGNHARLLEAKNTWLEKESFLFFSINPMQLCARCCLHSTPMTSIFSGSHPKFHLALVKNQNAGFLCGFRTNSDAAFAAPELMLCRSRPLSSCISRSWGMRHGASSQINQCHTATEFQVVFGRMYAALWSKLGLDTKAQLRLSSCRLASRGSRWVKAWLFLPVWFVHSMGQTGVNVCRNCAVVLVTCV